MNSHWGKVCERAIILKENLASILFSEKLNAKMKHRNLKLGIV